MTSEKFKEQTKKTIQMEFFEKRLNWLKASPSSEWAFSGRGELTDGGGEGRGMGGGGGHKGLPT